MRQVEAVESVSVDYDEYVPLTITWRNASEMLDPPLYVVWQDENGYLEFKFNPSTGILVEVVLVSASGLIVEQASLSPSNSENAGLMPFLDFDGTAPEIEDLLSIKAYSDYLCISFGSNADRWVGFGPVLFGLADGQRLTAICAKWTGSERESVLAGQSDQDTPGPSD